MKPEIKKLLILNLPYLLFVWLFDKVGAAVRLSHTSGRESACPDGRGRVHACGAVGIERSEDRTLLTRVKRRCAVRVLSYSLRVLPRPCDMPAALRRAPPNIPQIVH